MDLNENNTLSNFTLRHKLKLWNSVFIAVLQFTVTVGFLIMSISNQIRHSFDTEHLGYN
jgi:hypothetical protein